MMHFNMQTDRQARLLSPHALKQLNRRHRRLYGQDKGGESHNSKNHVADESVSSTLQAAITETQATDASAEIYITIKLLGKVTMTIHGSDGTDCDVPLDLNPKAIQLLAYIAWKRGASVQRYDLITAIWDPEEEAEDKKLGWAFNGAMKDLRAAVKKSIEAWNEKRGERLLDPKDPKLDIFAFRHQMWRLSSHCKVIDLDVVDQQYQIIIQAKKQGMLINTIPDYVKTACDALKEAYTGDYLDKLIRCHPPDIRTWANVWVREPITYYRDCYLQAIWYAAEYDVQAGKRLMEQGASDKAARLMQRECWARAAELYRLYAMYACNNQYDMKIYFGRGSGCGERVAWSERALRNCLMLCAKLGDAYPIDDIYNPYYDQMRNISDENWEPSDETLKALQTAKEQVAAYQPEE